MTMPPRSVKKPAACSIRRCRCRSCRRTGIRSSPLGIGTFRIRAALGKSGRQPNAFDKFTTFAPLTSELGAGLAPANLGNPDLKPEVSTEWEVGAEIGTWDNRLGFDYTYWNRTVSDALIAKQFPLSG